MAAGNNRHYKIREIAKRHWLQAAKSARFPKSEIEKIIHEIFIQTPAVLTSIKDLSPKDFPDEIAVPILNGMSRLAAQLNKNQHRSHTL